MGQSAQTVALLLLEHIREPFTGPVLSYGLQSLNIKYPGALAIFESLGIRPDPAGMSDTPLPDTVMAFSRVIKLMGLGDLETLDVSDYEGAEIIADLNAPIPPEFRGRYGLIVDGGTMEHVFDLRQGMKNTADMLRPGGRVVHMSPANNYVNHGFVQLSPAFYHEYYTENGFEDVRGILAVQPRAEIANLGWNFLQYDHATMGGANSIFCPEGTQLAVYFTARKTRDSTSDRVPARSYERRLLDGVHLPGNQVVLTHDPATLNVRRIVEPEVHVIPPPHEVVHVGFGSGRAPARIAVED
jgi:hypothetical protein